MPAMGYKNGEKTNEITKTQLRDSQARLSGIIASAMDAIISVDSDYRILLFNHSAEMIFGYRAGQVLGKPLDILLPERFRAIHRQHMRNFEATGVTNRSMGKLGRLFGLRSNGEEFQIEASISQVTVAGGTLFSVILRDITEQVKAEQAMAESEAYLQATFDLAAVGISHIALDGRWIQVNRKVCEITGYSSEEIMQMRVQDITPDDYQPGDRNLRSQLVEGKIESYAREKRYRRKDGSLTWVSVNSSLVRDQSGEPKFYVNIIEDISDRKRTEEALQARTAEISAMTQQLWQAAKLATMGELAASVAHELNNPLAILSLRIESLLSGMTSDRPESKELTIMEQEVDRMASLVKNLLQFSRPNERQISTLDVKEEVYKTLELIHSYLVNRGIDTKLKLDEALPLIQADRQQLRQLFLNLFTNAIDAMAPGGSLSVRVETDEDKKYIRIVVKDTGSGIRSEYINHVMEPFFTTKPGGKGTGLGLSICRRIVEEHKGTIRIYSPGENQGTEVEVRLPKANEVKTIFLDE